MDMGPFPCPNSCPSKNGMGTAKRGSPVAAPFYTPLPDAGQEGHTPPGSCRDPGYLGNLVSGRGQETQLHCRWRSPDQSSLSKATATPFSASLRFKPKAAFLYLKKKKSRKPNTTPHKL